jgi:TRAP transporter TAXI family solute receptor
LQSAGLGVASIRDLATSMKINVVAVPAADVEKIGSPYVSVVIPANTYDGQAEDVQTAAVGNFLISHDGVSDEAAYQMTKQLFENLPALAAAHAAAKAIDPAKALDGMPIPLHPGAEQYYKEAGILK